MNGHRQGSGRGRELGLLAALATLLLFSCSDPGIRIHGRILLPDGSPAAGVTVYFTPWTVVDRSGEQADTDANGDFAFVTDAQGTGLDGDLTVILSVASGPDSLMVVVDTYGDDVAIPPLRFWGAQATVASDASGGVEVSWPTPPEGTPPSYQVRVFQGQIGVGYAPTWMSDPMAVETYVVPPEVTEDRLAYVQVLAGDVRCSHAIGVTGICVTQQTSALMVPLGTKVPLSRGATCTAGSPGQEAPLLTLGAPPCPLTDGLIATAMPRCETGACPEDVVVDLGAATEIHSLVVHGASVDTQAGVEAELVLETSTDGVVFTEAARFGAADYGGESFKMLSVPQPTLARQVRLRVDGASLRTLTELAVF
jgi:hypothetical protein